ncbi:flagellin lysine-N-methylase [Peribacillus glennii]|uniref:Lysine-N-methylase n=1 Tax=Peribacillus glennii TaxID=2303991 RepID=A0A372LDW6_9BACI|nr:flagellin lysine-N-methylase [Peribacillus glennii]RFU63943.1 lysine-N-methylase [Peribacillus glennii]
MSQKTRSLLIPQYMNQFSCIGSACEDSCCAGWQVNIDQKTYKKYKKSHDLELKPLFHNKLARTRANSSTEAYAKIKMDQSGCCSFLSEDRLCKIQLNLGEEFLSNTCAIYPRHINEINGVVEKSITLSCPEAARQVLLNQDGIEFIETTEPMGSRTFIGKRLDTRHSPLTTAYHSYFWDLRIFTIQLLQNRVYSVDERLMILGMFYNKVQQYIEQHKTEEIPAVIDSFTRLIEDGSLIPSLKEIPALADIQMKLCKELVDHRYSQGINNQRYKECLTEMLVGLGFTNDASMKDVAGKYEHAYISYYKPFMDEHNYILENYLVNHVFKNLFPLGQATVYDDYVMLIVHYAMIKLHLIGMSGYHKGMTTDYIIKLIQSFAKTVEHNTAYLNNIFTLLRENDLTTMAYMAVLIKN